MSPKNDTQASAKSTTATGKKSGGFTEEELAAMKDRAKEEKAAAKRTSLADKAVEEENEVVEKIAELSEPDRSIAERIHAIIKASAPALAPKLWYGMPAYAKEGKIVCFFQSAQKFKTRYATFGFNDAANLDEDNLWPVAFALREQELSAADEARISELVKKAAR